MSTLTAMSLAGLGMAGLSLMVPMRCREPTTPIGKGCCRDVRLASRERPKEPSYEISYPCSNSDVLKRSLPIRLR